MNTDVHITNRHLYTIARAGAVISAALFVVLFLSGCRYTAAPADLLQEPDISEDKARLVQAIDKALSKYSKLTLPLREETDEAIRLIDVDGDGQAEAIVSFYDEYSSSKLLVLKKQNSTWKPWTSIEQPLARQIEWLHISELNGDGFMELIVGWTGTLEGPNILEIYSFQSKPVRNEEGKQVLQPLESMQYSYADIGDISGDGRKTLAVISETGAYAEMADKEYNLTLYGWSSGSMRQIARQPLFNGVNGYDRLIMGSISPRHHGIILEASAGAHSMYTSMYKWENRNLQLVYPNAQFEDEGLSVSSTRSEDINGDGIIELHRIKEPPGYEFSYADTAYVNQWVQWDGRDQYKLIAEEYSDYHYGVQVRIPDEWLNKYTIRKADVKYGLVVLEYWREKTKKTAPISTLYAVPQQQWLAVEADWKERGMVYRVALRDSGNVFAISYATEAPDDLSGDDALQFKEMMNAGERIDALVTAIEIN